MKKQHLLTTASFPTILLTLVGMLFASANRESQAGDPVDEAAVQGASPSEDGDLEISGYLDGGFRETMFFEDGHDAALLEWDLRFEYWGLFDEFVAGPYLRIAGIAASEDPAFENNWQALPGAGLQVYPFSKEENYLGPLRVFGEYNLQDYWGSENSWRPDDQFRAGIDYFLSIGSNDPSQAVWVDFWSGLIWQSSNDFDASYNGVILANALRLGLRAPEQDLLSMITPYGVVESKINLNDTAYPEWWNNKLDLGGGVRLAPSLDGLPECLQFIDYGNIYAEWVYTVAYYRDSAPNEIPDHEFRAGIRLGIGDFIKQR